MEGKTPMKENSMAKNENSLAASLTTIADVTVPTIDEGTMLRINIDVEDKTGAAEWKTLTYAALYVNNQWYLTGSAQILSNSYRSTLDLMSALGRLRRVRIDLVTEYEKVKG
jgi:hypothetical protein